MNVWLFGYGSLMWRPDFRYLDRRRARLRGWQRRFWQGSHDHRGMPGAPGRVVTLVEAAGHCEGIAFLIDARVAGTILARLDHREQDGYRRTTLPIEFDDATCETAIAWVAATDHRTFLGPAPRAEIAAQIRRSRGPSGANAEYLFELANALRALDVDDPHVFDLEAAVREDNG